MTRTTDRQRTAVALLTLIGALLCALAVAGLVLYRFQLLRPWLYHPAIFGVPGCIALAVAGGLGFRRPLIKWLGVTLFLLAAVAAGFVGWLTSAFTSELTEEARYQSPDGSMELVVYGGSGFTSPDPVWELRMHTREGLLSRENDLGCVNPDTVSLTGIDWIGPRAVRVGLSTGVVDIALDDRGRPDRTIDGGC
jgi:hypothetical protein